ncbi:MAG: PEP/pyruvate-binding domain-containing protein [Spirochaetota bacterium]
MELLEHVFYHELLDGRCSLADAVRTIEKVLIDRGQIDPERLCGEAERYAHEMEHPDEEPGSGPHTPHGPAQTVGCSDSALAERTYGALLVKTLFESSTTAEIRDVINLSHKEAVAREIWLRLRDEPVNLQEVERLLQEFAELPLGESQVSPNISIGIRVQLISTLISDNLFYIGVAKNHITMRDVAALMDRFIGKYGQRSRVGGKSAGMILANRILRPVFGEPTGLEDRIAEVSSYYLTAQVFNRFIEHNRLQEGHSLKYMEADEREAAQGELKRRFHRGTFPEEVREHLAATLDELGDGPLIVRSSSLLEDSMGFPFYGKYESVFLSNQGARAERLESLVGGIKDVYVSILASSVLEYRRDKALLDYDDMMCVLIQRVVGARHGDYYYPDAAGVAFSRNQYRWSRRIDPEAGVARIVFGLGTRAVDRSGDDYPRLVALSHPALRPEGTQNEKLKYSQRYADVLNLETRSVESVHFVDIVNHARETGERYEPVEAISLVEDGKFSTPRIFPERLEYGGAAITFERLLADDRFASLLREVLRRLEDAYGVPVDVEFAWHAGKLYVLQCRPLAQGERGHEAVSIPQPGAGQRVLFDTHRDVFGNAVREGIRYIVSVDGERYHTLGESTLKLEVARTLGRVNRALARERFMLVGPGRWGSSNLDLGVRVSYADINHATVLAEVGSTRTGYTPEVSYGTHFFQDLVEADIVPLALFPDEQGERFDEAFLAEAPNHLTDLVPEASLPQEEVAACITVIDLDSWGPGRLSIYLDADNGRAVGLLGATP